MDLHSYSATKTAMKRVRRTLFVKPCSFNNAKMCINSLTVVKNIKCIAVLRKVSK